MMTAPDKVIVRLGHPQQGTAHQGGLPQLKPPPQVRLEKRLEPPLLLVQGQPSPVLLDPRQFNSFADHLQRFIQTLPQKGRAQAWMPLQYLLPGPFKTRYLQVPT